MIFDKIENTSLYQNLHPGFTKAFDYLRNTDFSKLEDGKYKIDGDDIFALVQQYETRDSANAKLETHYQYIDIQYIHVGTELIGVSPLYNQLPSKKDHKKDIAFYEGDASFIRLTAGMFAIFFPDDMHMPGIKTKESEIVKKVVIKVKK